ncbi:HAMP domain-containing histidine kinase [Arthrobacter sp. I2-34]|uniref:histidine kinase n=1 Tax=Arthrobacter hankyongi TaxID=2904801 RepID=A0ABS9LD09_9MICC|nr:HAMP domain-containing sensor histidine kinase [Arthrobacter hankyongi]MCG2624574.1 HAMP domain-containing histidine kinase [Arthrobacter hankyongi]
MNGREQAELRQAVKRLAVRFTALMLVLLALVGALVYTIVASAASQSVQQALREATQAAEPKEVPPGVFVAVLDAGRLEVSRGMPEGLPVREAMSRVSAGAGTVEEQVDVGGRLFTVRTVRHEGMTVQAAVDLHESREELRRLLLALGMAGLLAVGVAVFIAVWMARRAMQPMAEALAMQRRFVADASHELRTPLTLLSTRAQLLRRRLGRDAAGGNWQEIAGGVDEILEDSRQLTGILEDLLISADPREAASPEPVQLQAEADSAVAAQGPLAARRGLELVRTGDQAAVTVAGSKVSLQRVFTALIANALDHARSKVQVEVTARGRDAVIRVSDDGEGFAPMAASRAFERFASSRSDSGSQRHYGLGLALVAEIAARHHGTVRIEPARPGQGATVVVTLPLVQPSS